MTTDKSATRQLRATIVGASGIGKHHAKWLRALGAEVMAIVGSSPESAARTAANLQATFGIEARPFTDIGEMLEVIDPDLVSVCTPPRLHHEHVLALAPHRCHLMCEKPLTWDDTKPREQLLAEAREMVTACQRPGRCLAVNLQYTAIPPAYYRLCEKLGVEARPPRQFMMRMDSRRETNVYEIIWRELSPHTISVMVSFCGPGEIDHNTVDLEIEKRHCRAHFLYQSQGGPGCECELTVGTTTEGPLARRLGINGVVVNYEGRNDEKGVFRTYLRLGETESQSEDLMYLSLRQFVLAAKGEVPRPLATLAEGLANQEMQLEILSRGRRI